MKEMSLFHVGLVLIFIGFILAIIAALLPVILLAQPVFEGITPKNITRSVNITIGLESPHLILLTTMFLVLVVTLVTMGLMTYMVFKWTTRVLEESKREFRGESLV